MEKEILKEISKDLKWYEKIIIRLFDKIFISTYKLGVKKGFKLGNY